MTEQTPGLPPRFLVQKIWLMESREEVQVETSWEQLLKLLTNHDNPNFLILQCNISHALDNKTHHI